VTDLSVVVVCWNTRELALACLDTVAREVGTGAAPGPGPAGLVVETLLVDNGSSDGTSDAVRERHPWAVVVELAENLGFAGGSNAGLTRARGRIVLLLNSDAAVTRAAVRECVSFLDAHPRAGIAGPQLLHSDGRLQNSVHAFPSLWTELVPTPLLEWAWPRRYPSKRRPSTGPVPVEAVLGAALFIRREAIEQVGPLDDGYFFFLEETDWCWRMAEAGWGVWHLPAARMTHLSGASSKQVDSTRTRIEFHRSLYRFFRLRRGRWALAAVVVLRVLKNALPLLAPPLGPRQRRRWRDRVSVLGWHLRGCPADAGLAGRARFLAREGDGRPIR